jgi:hypothetical protein
VEENNILLLLQYITTQRQKAKLLNSKWVNINKIAKNELNVIRSQNLKILVVLYMIIRKWGNQIKKNSIRYREENGGLFKRSKELHILV